MNENYQPNNYHFSDENVRHFPTPPPSMEPAVPIPPTTKTSSDSMAKQIGINVIWAAIVVLLGGLNWMPKRFMAASLVVNLIVSGASLMRKTPETAKVVTELNKGFVIITVLAMAIEWLFGHITFVW